MYVASDLNITEETLLVEMHKWCIKICIVFILHFNSWVEASAGRLLVPEGLYSSVAKYFVTCKIRVLIVLANLKQNCIFKFISKRRSISLMHSSILRRIWLNFMALFGFFFGSSTDFHIFWISNFFGLRITEETLLVE
jgi:hypothetical protein